MTYLNRTLVTSDLLDLIMLIEDEDKGKVSHRQERIDLMGKIRRTLTLSDEIFLFDNSPK